MNTPDQESRAMFVARLQNKQENGERWLTIQAVLGLLNDCDMLATQGQTEEPQVEQPSHRVQQKAAYWDYLIELAGHWQDGSSQPVTLTDDDACRISIIRWGRGVHERQVVGGSFESCIKQIMKERG